MSTELWNHLLSFIRSHWYSRTGLFCLMVVVTLAYLLLAARVKIEDFSLAEMILLTVVLLVTFGIWHHVTKLPKTPGGMVGFVVAIHTEDKKHAQKLSSDFVETIRGLLERGKSHHPFFFLETSDYHASKIQSPEDAKACLDKTRSQFILHGRARMRMLNGRETHVLDLNGRVRHRPIAAAVSQGLSREFTEVLPRGWRIPVENDLLAFEFTADWIVVVAKYIIGIAGYLSGDLDYARSLYEGLRVDLSGSKNLPPPIDKIRRRLPTRLGETYASHAALRYRHWKHTRDRAAIEAMGPYLEELAKVDCGSYTGHLLRSIFLFVTQKPDVSAALTEIRRCKEAGIKDTTWRFSYAFLLAYRGDLQQAWKQYQIAFRGPVQATVPVETEDFMLWLLDEEPDKVALHFCLGLVNKYAKKDDVRALEELTEFLQTTDAGDRKLCYARSKAQSECAELKRILRSEQLPELQ